MEDHEASNCGRGSRSWVVVASPAAATHQQQGPKIVPPGQPNPVCGSGHEFAQEAAADPTKPGATELQFTNSPDPFPPPFCSRAEKKLNP